jgi:colanic acid/amylovoran biosynthesis glycosyltransferase
MPLSIACLIGRFPAATEHAVMEEIASVETLGVQPIILATRLTGKPLPPEFASYRDKVKALDVGRTGGLLRAVGSALSGGAALLRAPGGLKCRPFDTAAPLGGSTLWRRPKLYAALRNSGAQLLHAEFGHLGLLAQPVAEKLRIPLVVSFRGQDVLLIRRAKPSRRQALTGGAALILARSEDMRRDLVALGFPEDKTVVHPSGIRVAGIPFSERKSPATEEDTVILMAGRMVPKKGMPDALRAFGACRPGFGGPRLRIAGDGPQRLELEQLARSLNISERVVFLGAMPRTELLREMLSAHLFILPCRTAPDGEKEGIPNVLKEAQAAGLPVLSTTHAGIPEAVADRESGYLAPEGDVAELARRLDDLLSHPADWPAMGRRGRAFIEERFDSAKLAPLLMQYYDTVM